MQIPFLASLLAEIKETHRKLLRRHTHFEPSNAPDSVKSTRIWSSSRTNHILEILLAVLTKQIGTSAENFDFPHFGAARNWKVCEKCRFRRFIAAHTAENDFGEMFLNVCN